MFSFVGQNNIFDEDNVALRTCDGHFTNLIVSGSLLEVHVMKITFHIQLSSLNFKASLTFNALNS